METLTSAPATPVAETATEVATEVATETAAATVSLTEAAPSLANTLTDTLTQEADAELGGQAAASVFLMMILTPFVELRRVKTKTFYVPVSLQKPLLMLLLVCINVALGIAMGKPPIFAANAALSGCAIAFGVQGMRKSAEQPKAAG